MKALILTVALLMAAPAWGESFEIGDDTVSRARTVLGAIQADLDRTQLDQESESLTQTPTPPQFPRNFSWKGRYIVRDLEKTVTFTWTGNNGNSQMIAGSWEEDIYFTNIIYDNILYTLTYKWPTPIPGPGSCSKIGEFTLEQLNDYLLHNSRYVGPEILEETEPRYVNHFRAGLVFQDPNDPIVRFPLMLGDFYVDREDPNKIWKVLHFGLQNLYDAALDEWIVLESFEDTPGEVNFPIQCSPTWHR